MGNRIEYKRFFVISESGKKYFNTDFSSCLNLIHGKNTSGKSTLIQAIQYTFGINSEKKKLEEVLSEQVIFRIDFELLKNDNHPEIISIIRSDEILIIKREDQPLIKFNGIGADNSQEHIKLKKYLADLCGFNLLLESSGKYKEAAIEAMFLPYYIAQDVGWIYKHKSFRGLDFVKNFKKDFFDYYLGIHDEYDRDAKRELEEKKKECDDEIKFLSQTECNNEELHLSKLLDEKFVQKTVEYLTPYKINKSELIKLEKDYLSECNKLAFLEQRKSVLTKVKRAIIKQNPINAFCPTCNQSLPNKLENIYNYHQDLNDTETQFLEIKKIITQMKSAQSKINSLSKKITCQQGLIENDYSILSNYSTDKLSFPTWLDNKTNVQLSENVKCKIGELTITLNDIKDNLKKFKSVVDIEEDRNSKDNEFKGYFGKYLNALHVKTFEDCRYLFLYGVPDFPKQGVELLKTLLAYNFAFNKIIEHTSYIHRFPFLMDAIFEGDFEKDNKEIILTFISKYYPQDTQTIITIADTKDNDVSVIDYNSRFFEDKANLICIGNNQNERAFLSDYNKEFEEYVDELFSYLD